jgi:hypothetical protein
VNKSIVAHIFAFVKTFVRDSSSLFVVDNPVDNLWTIQHIPSLPQYVVFVKQKLAAVNKKFLGWLWKTKTVNKM